MPQFPWWFIPIQKFVLRHPKKSGWLAALIFLSTPLSSVIGFLANVSGVWALGSSRPLLQAILDSPILAGVLSASSFLPFPATWITVPVGGVMLLFIISQLMRQRAQPLIPLQVCHENDAAANGRAISYRFPFTARRPIGKVTAQITLLHKGKSTNQINCGAWWKDGEWYQLPLAGRLQAAIAGPTRLKATFSSGSTLNILALRFLIMNNQQNILWTYRREKTPDGMRDVPETVPLHGHMEARLTLISDGYTDTFRYVLKCSNGGIEVSGPAD